MANDEHSRIVLQIGIPTDRSGYLRHECPSCMLEFKIKGNESRFTDELATWVSKDVPGIEPDAAASDEKPELTCPYCSHRDKAQEFLHRELRALMIRVGKREIIEPMLFGMFNELEKSFSSHRSGAVTIRIESNVRSRSPRPLVGPEPDDMIRIACLACNEHFKLVEGWSSPVCCPTCFAQLRLE